jgi:hypothetical protein
MYVSSCAAEDVKANILESGKLLDSMENDIKQSDDGSFNQKLNDLQQQLNSHGDESRIMFQRIDRGMNDIISGFMTFVENRMNEESKFIDEIEKRKDAEILRLQQENEILRDALARTRTRRDISKEKMRKLFESALESFDEMVEETCNNFEDIGRKNISDTKVQLELASTRVNEFGLSSFKNATNQIESLDIQKDQFNSTTSEFKNLVDSTKIRMSDQLSTLNLSRVQHFERVTSLAEQAKSKISTKNNDGILTLIFTL